MKWHHGNQDRRYFQIKYLMAAIPPVARVVRETGTGINTVARLTCEISRRDTLLRALPGNCSEESDT